VTVIEHFRIWQVSQITLSLIINATGDSTTTMEITMNKAMQRVPWPDNYSLSGWSSAFDRLWTSPKLEGFFGS